MDESGERRGGRFQPDLTRHARCTVRRGLEVAGQIVVFEGSDEKNGDINRHFDAHGPERAETPHAAIHFN
jgi:hypothetical protein